MGTNDNDPFDSGVQSGQENPPASPIDSGSPVVVVRRGLRKMLAAVLSVLIAGMVTWATVSLQSKNSQPNVQTTNYGLCNVTNC